MIGTPRTDSLLSETAFITTDGATKAMNEWVDLCRRLEREGMLLKGTLKVLCESIDVLKQELEAARTRNAELQLRMASIEAAVEHEALLNDLSGVTGLMRGKP